MLVNAVLKFNDVIKKLKFPQCFEKCKLPVLINMAANVSSKTSRERKLNFTAVESNLISELATTHLELLQGKHSPEVTNAKKQEMWKEITSKVNALGVCLRTETEVRNRWRNLTRGAKQKFTTVQKERTQTGGGPPPTQPSQAEENIINCMKDTASFRGVPGGQETLIEGPEGNICLKCFQITVIMLLKQSFHSEIYKTHFNQKAIYRLQCLQIQGESQIVTLTFEIKIDAFLSLQY